MIELTQLAICLRQSGIFLPYCFSFSLAERKRKTEKRRVLCCRRLKGAYRCTYVCTNIEWSIHDMAKQTFPVGAAPRIVLNGCSGDLEIEVWDERSVEIETDGSVRRLDQT